MRYTLLSDGSSDRALIPILTWLLRQALPTSAIEPHWADLRRVPEPPSALAERICLAIELYPCDLLFVHRDAETAPMTDRVAEIRTAVRESAPTRPPAVCVVPVRMTEAWLLFDEDAIRSAAGNPNGRVTLDLPAIGGLEAIPDPKQLLYDCLREASELYGRRLKKFRPAARAVQVTQYISDYSPLRQLPAFRALCDELALAVQQLP